MCSIQHLLMQKTLIYEGSNITKGQLLAMLMAHTLKHHVSGVALKEMLEMLNIIAPGCVPNTMWYLNKTFFNLADKAQIHYYCPECLFFLGQNPPERCSECNCVINQNQCLQDNFFFLVMPLSCQIKNLLQQPNIYHALRSHFNSDDLIGDIQTGKEYQNPKLSDFVENTKNITLSFNCDVSPVFKSSRYSIWPILCTINELPLEERGNNVMLHTFRFGSKKPRVDTYFSPFVEDLQQCYTDGVEWQDQYGIQHTTKVCPLICV